LRLRRELRGLRADCCAHSGSLHGQSDYASANARRDSYYHDEIPGNRHVHGYIFHFSSTRSESGFRPTRRLHSIRIGRILGNIVARVFSVYPIMRSTRLPGESTDFMDERCGHGRIARSGLSCTCPLASGEQFQRRHSRDDVRRGTPVSSRSSRYPASPHEESEAAGQQKSRDRTATPQGLTFRGCSCACPAGTLLLAASMRDNASQAEPYPRSTYCPASARRNQ